MPKCDFNNVAKNTCLIEHFRWLHLNMNSYHCENWKLKMTGKTQNGRKGYIFIVIPQLRNPDGARFVKVK